MNKVNLSTAETLLNILKTIQTDYITTTVNGIDCIDVWTVEALEKLIREELARCLNA